MQFFKYALTFMFAVSLGAAAHATPAGDKAREEIKKAFGFVPAFFKAVPDSALPGAWGEMAGLEMNPKTALSDKAKELIGLAVASQVPCRYCIYAHTEFAKLSGATALPGAWAEMRDVEFNDKSAIDPKTKSLVGIAVAAQIPCRFCLIADTAFAKLGGATQQEIDEALLMAAATRHWSTILNGLQVDENGFKRDVDRLVRDARKAAAVK